MGDTTSGDRALPIADRPEALTADWLTGALRANGHLAEACVAEVDLTPVGTGQMCDSLRLHLRYDGVTDSPPTMVAKLPAADETSRATALSLGSYENEVRFYQEVAAGLPVSTPAVFHADIDVETASFVLLLADAAPATQGDQLAGCSVEVAEVALDELVQLHAPRWGDPTLADLPWLHRDREQSQQFLLMLLPMLWKGFRERYESSLSSWSVQAGELLMAHLEPYLFADTEPWSILHGDYRLDNLLFDASPSGVPVTVVDWQTVSHGPPLQDVAYFLGAGLLEEERRAVEQGLVRRYHDALLSEGVADYGWERCWQDYRRGSWAGLVMAIAASMLVERTDRGDQMFLTMASRHAHHAMDLDAVELIRS